MALVREPMGYDGFEAEASIFDYGHDAAALFGGYATAEPAGTSAGYVPDSATTSSWPSASVLAFDGRAARSHGATAAAEDDCDAWIDAMDDDRSYGSPPSQRAAPSIGYDPALGCFSLMERPAGAAAGRTFGLLFPSTSSSSPEAAAPTRASQKRTYVGAEARADGPMTKKQCGARRKTGKAKPAPATASPTKDPQSLAAKNRRERISERLRTLQELVPNGTKVDMVTMLEKAISYVKFLQLQVKVLATDEFWPAQGGKAPEISQVKEALDAILSSSQRGQLH